MISFGMIPNEYVRLCNQFPPLAEATEYAITRFPENREIQAGNNKFNFGVYQRTQSHYCDIDRAQAQWRSMLKEQQASASVSNFKIELPAIENSPLVPEKKSK